MKKKEKNKRGLFVTFEGGEGSGKTTAITRVLCALQEEEIEAIKTCEPGGTPIGENIRNLLLQRADIPLSKRAELFLFLADRAEHVAEVILPALEQKQIVLCDRFTDSTFAYQADLRKELGEEWRICTSIAAHDLIPDLTILLDIDPEVGLKRAAHAKGEIADRLEERSVNFHRSVRRYFLELAQQNKERFYVLDGTLEEEELADRIFCKLKQKWNQSLCIN